MKNLTSSSVARCESRAFSRSWARRLILLALLLAPLAAVAATGTPARDAKGKLLNMIVASGNGIYYSQNARTGNGTKLDREIFGRIFVVGKGGHADPETDPAGKLIEALDFNNNIIGYFRGEDVVYGRALHAIQAPKAGSSPSAPVPSNIFRKALIVNYYDKLDDATLQRNLASGEAVQTKSGGWIVHVPALVAPEVSSKDNQNVLSNLELWEHRFVWKEAKGRGGEVWYLLGDKGDVTDPETEKSGLIGWVPADKVRLWDTSQALEPNWLTRDKRVRDLGASAPARVYSDLGAADQSATLVDVSGLNAQAMVSEDTSYAARQWPPERSRYPLIEAKALGRSNQIYQAAWIGGLYDSATGETVIADAGEVDAGQETVRKAIRGLFTLDVLIVLDGTKSMSHLRGAAMEAVSKIVQQVRSQVPEGWKVRPEDQVTRCAVAVYRNRNDAGGPFKSFEFSPFQRLDGDAQGPAKIMDFFKTITFDSRERKIREEGVLDGIVKAAEQARLGQKSNPDSYKLMIVIGDSGDQGGGTTIEEAAKVLNESHYDFYAISVPREEEVAKHVDFQEFREQLAKLVGSLELPRMLVDKPEAFDPSTHVLTLDNDRLVPSILQACEKGVRIRNKVAKVLANPKEYPMQLQAFVQNFLKGRVNMELFKSNRQQVLGVGWTTARDAKDWQQWQVMEYVERKSLDAYRRFVQPFEILNTTNDSVDPGDIDDIIKSLKVSFQVAAGQYDGTRRINEIMGDAARDLPVRSNLLAMTVPELQDYLGKTDPTIRRARQLELERLKLCSKVLQLYVIDRDFSYQTDSRGRVVDVKEDERRTVSYWSSRGNFDYGWIPQEVFP